MSLKQKADKMYRHLLSAGYTKKDAARTAQAKVGVVLKTGKPPMRGIK